MTEVMYWMFRLWMGSTVAMASRGFLSTTLCSGLTRLRHVVWVTFASQIPFCLIFILTSLWSNDGCHHRQATIDRISDLPDELLHIVLLRLRSNGDAPRTSVLSYCWRHVWAKLPKIVLDYHDPPPQDVIPKLLNSVDDALAAYSSAAPAVIKRLEVALPGRSGTHIPAYRVSNWLRFTSQRKATRIELFLKHQWHLWFPLAASFSMLTDLVIHDTSVELDELESLVCSKQCLRLRNLQIVNVQSLSVDVFSVRSNSLVSLRFDAWIQNATFPFRLKVVAPRLEELRASCDVV
ncbi:putative FBD-associated F-box protein At1g78730 [Setaria italica]|uniref:putative FBD-associated F-box protein At1g78730 n=1 Tax=Setaria italica TaxID=4555 RepID=UPI000350C9B1|nr:putative FBD-associated F-box protein At1g78730 [Setaria italica]